jgi:hypothetical protein
LSEDLLISPPDELARTGAPYDIFTLSDIEQGGLPLERYRLCIFLNTFLLHARYRRIIEERILAEGNSVLWIYAPGYITESGFSTDAISEAVGMNIEMLDAFVGRATTVAGDILAPLEEEIDYGFTGSPLPLFAVNDTGATPLARYRNGAVALAYKDHESGGKVFYSALGNLPARVLREIARSAGVHIYYEGHDPVYINSRLIGIHQQTDEPHTISLPRDGVSLVEQFDGNTVSATEGAFDVPSHSRGVQLFLSDRDLDTP